MASSSRRQRARALLVHLAFLAGSASADVVPMFVWGFKTLTTTSLLECNRLQIFVNSTGGSTAPKPPYTFVAYEAAGIPTVQLLGSDPNNLWWTVDHASQTQLILSMADAAGNAGGVAPNVYNVISSTTGSSCHAQNPTSAVSITTNTTKSITSCDVLPLKMSGGTKPYTISVASLGSSITANFTLGSAFDTYDWVNRASPNSKIIAAVSDANGVYAPSTNLLSTSGSTDLTCGNRPSTEIDSEGHTPSVQVGVDGTTSPTSQNSSNNSSSSNKPSTATIIAGIVGGALLLAVVAMGAFFFFRQRKVKARDPRAYPIEDSYGGLGLGKVRGPGPGSVLPEEAAPFVAPAGLGIPYMDNPYERNSYSSRYSTSVSENMYAPAMQARGSSYTLPPEIMPYPIQQLPPVNTMSQPFTGQAAPRAFMSISTRPESFDPYRASVGATVAPSIAPTSPTESIGGGMIAGPSMGLAYAMSTSSAGSSSKMAMAMARDEAGPSTSRVVDATPVQETTDTKQGAVPPPARQQSVYQHEDVSDVVELPPAYKERTGEH